LCRRRAGLSAPAGFFAAGRANPCATPQTFDTYCVTCL
jgi:hypothetical protein